MKSVLPPKAIIPLNGNNESLVNLEDGKAFLKTGYHYTKTTDFPLLPVTQGKPDVVVGVNLVLQESGAYSGISGVTAPPGSYIYAIGSYGATGYSRLMKFSQTGRLVSHNTVDWGFTQPTNDSATSLSYVNGYFWISTQYNSIYKFNMNGTHTNIKYQADRNVSIIDSTTGPGDYLYVLTRIWNDTAVVVKVDPNTGNKVSKYTISTIKRPMGITYLGDKFYITDYTTSKITILSSSFSKLGEKAVGRSGRMATKGNSIIVQQQRNLAFFTPTTSASYVGTAGTVQEGTAHLYLCAKGSEALSDGETLSKGGVSINSLAMVNATENVFVNKQGHIYLKTGIIETDVSKYPDAIVTPANEDSPEYVGMKNAVVGPKGSNTYYLRVK